MSVPIIVQLNVETIPRDLRELSQWVVWKLEPRLDGKDAKVPYDPQTGRRADATRPETGAPFGVALATLQSQRGYAGLGFILTNSPFAAVDLDNCVDAEGAIADWALAILDQVHSYSELSPSGHGIRIIASGQLPNGRRRRAGVEMYDTDRYVTVTGQWLEGYPRAIHECTRELATIHRAYLADSDTCLNDQPCRINLDDDELLRRIRASKQAPKFERLWAGDTSEYQSHSEADLALATMLAFWTDRDPERIERLFNQSGLCRDKWRRADYRERTITRALAFTNETYQAPVQQNGSHDHNAVADDGSNRAEHRAAMYPDPPDVCVYQGFAGEIVRALEPDTEADPVALLLSLLAAVGSILGRGPHWRVGTRVHHLRIFPVLVGATAKGRKGTSWAAVRPVLRTATADESGESLYLLRNVVNGLSSGEGLIWAVRDPITKTEPIKENRRVVEYQEVVVDPGIADKRLFVIEEEFASVLRVMSREGNTLSSIIRQAWDDGDLRTMTKNSPARATGAHITILGHVTRDELRRYLTSTEMGNGFANRFFWTCVRRSKLLPDGGYPDPAVIHALGDQLGHVFETAEHIGFIERDDDASQLWREIYGPLTEGGMGLLGAVTSRAEAQVMRIASLFAILEESHLVNVAHLTAALKLWEYIESSTRYIFGDSLGDPVADAILDALRRQGKLTRTDIRDLFGRHQSAARIDSALNTLLSAGLVNRATQPTGGRPVEEWTPA